jgi:hypothetical protein
MTGAAVLGGKPGTKLVFPVYLKPVSNFFRKRRNRRLSLLIERLSLEKGGPLDVLDIGGSLIFWKSIPENVRVKCNIILINLPGSYDYAPPDEDLRIRQQVSLSIGDARDLSKFSDGSFDLVVCNSVIEHVGSWLDMEAAAAEARRVGRNGWVQVPAFEFPVEQHYIIPLVHWFADPIQIKTLALLHRSFQKRSFHDQHMTVQHVRPLTRTQLRHLFPEAEVWSEWIIFPKSHIATW